MSRPDSILRPLVEIAHRLVAEVLRPGDLAVDATVGKGRDTLALARCVGPSGLVIGCDIQPSALEATHAALAREELAGHVRLHLQGHQFLKALLVEGEGRPLRAAMFNLGYLPGGDHGIVTRPTTTLVALAAAFEALEPGGLVTVMTYAGHPGAVEEKEAVLGWARSLDRRPTGRRNPLARTLAHEYLFAIGQGSTLLAIEKLPPS